MCHSQLKGGTNFPVYRSNSVLLGLSKVSTDEGWDKTRRNTEEDSSAPLPTRNNLDQGRSVVGIVVLDPRVKRNLS